jgi:acetylornithine deacetylase/succinyl-diaminopimelate desuccinylase-like protein
MLANALDYARAHREAHLNQLLDLLRIPSISTLPAHQADIQRAADWLVAELTRTGVKKASALPTGGHPVVYGEWLEAGPGAPTVLIYGHYDVQPVDPLNLWRTPPFEPTLREGRLYARGATDDKGLMLALVKAVEALLATGRPPVNLKFMIEGEEESGSANLERFVLANQTRLAADSVLISDTPFLAPGLPQIPYSVRGLAAVEVRVRGPKTDLHSGGFGGTVRNPASAIAGLIAAMHDEAGHVRIPGFYDRVRPLPAAEREALKKVPWTLEKWKQETGLEIPWGEPDYTLLERIGARPTCEVNGLWGGFQGEGTKTIIPAEAGAKFTMRLVTDQDPDEITRLFTEYVRAIAPKELRVEIIPREGCRAALTPIDTKEIQAAAQALEAVWGVAPVFSRGGGSLPIIATLQEELKAPVVLLGFGLPDSGAHAPNEWMEVEQFHKGTECAIRYFYQLRSDWAALASRTPMA